MNRRIASFLLPFGCISVSLCVVAACEDDPNPTSPGFDAQAPGFDANRPPTDSSIPDTFTPDADASSLPVTVTVRTPTGQPVSGATVVFGSAAGDVLQTLTSDATGIASAAVPSGSQVTVVFGSSPESRLVTITAVEPGDVIIATDLVTKFDPNAPTVSVANESDGGPAAFYYVYQSGSCSTQSFMGTPPFTYILQPECIGPAGKFPVVAEARDSNGAILGFQFQKTNTPPPDAGTFTPTFNTWSENVTQQTVIAANLHRDGGSNYLGYGEIADGVMIKNYSFVNDDGDGGGQVTFQNRNGYPEAVQYEVNAEVAPGGGGRSVLGNATRANAPTANGTTPIDFGTRLPEITGSSVEVDGGASARPIVAWTPAGSLATADGTYVVVRWNEDVDGSTKSGTWTFIVPPSATSVVAPTLPAAAVAAQPGSTANFTSDGRPRIVTVEASFVNGYGDFRKAAGVAAPQREIIDNYSTMRVPPLPSNGTVKFTAYTVTGD